MSASYRTHLLCWSISFVASYLGIFLLALPALLIAQSVPPALESPARGRPRQGHTARSDWDAEVS